MINGGSPVGPGFVVYERADGGKGYDLKLAKASVGKGWWPLLEQLFDAIEFNSKSNPGLGFNNVVIEQVKEKFGGLRIYFSGGNPPDPEFSQPVCNHWNYVDGYIQALERMSYHICEDCGAPGKTRKRAWIRTLCDVHAEGALPFTDEWDG